MKKYEIKERVCPKCGEVYNRPPALSREDNETFLCPDCGCRESLTILGISTEEQEEIIASIHRYENSE